MFSPTFRKYFVTMDVTFLKDEPFFPVSRLQGETTSEETNSSTYFVPISFNLEPSSPVPEPSLSSPEPGPDIPGSVLSDIPVSVLPTGQMPWITYYKKNLKKETQEIPVVLSESVQASKPAQVQDLVVSENVLEEKSGRIEDGETNSEKVEITGGNEVLEDSQEGEKLSQKLDTGERPTKTGNYDTILDMPIALRKETRSCTKYPMHSFLTYSNLSPIFKAFTTQLDALAIPTNVHAAMEVPEGRVAVMEEMKLSRRTRLGI
ncbi:uncharacterized protein LOC120086968 [Benincasa hispida]|uniref:uncharacterized protein LOC120086968 n=1 Tax=Benincasa hispida TaxID=102211 RepID=UPI0018FFCAAF|nr:uncharacterized protein LOC120086968 [Benincasa hispida]